MGDINTRVTYGTYQNCNKTFTSFTGAELRHPFDGGYIGMGLSVATDDLTDKYGLVDVKAKVNYDSKGIFEQNFRIRTALDDKVKSTHFRYSPFTVNIPLSDNVSINSNTHYSCKYNYKNNKWNHSLGNFTTISWDIDNKNNLSIEGQRYNLQDIKNNSSDNWGFNLLFTHKF